MVKPILKWAGGKRQLLEDIYINFPEHYNHYHEPMIGGGALFFDLEPKNGTINDVNPRLINFYETVRDNPKELLKISRSFKSPKSSTNPNKEFSEVTRNNKKIKNYYYQQREIFNRRPNGEKFDPILEAAILLYLNRTCFNGLYRENSSGEFNVPLGRYKNPDWIREAEILQASKVLKRITIYNNSFDYILEIAKQEDLVYFDPPYVPMSRTANFTDYNADGFDKEDQKRLLKVAKRLDKKGVNVIISNSGVMHDFYEKRGFYVEFCNAIRAINSNPNKRGEIAEIIATNIPRNERKSSNQKVLDEFIS
ncbi:MAG: DNA adenine methylase [Promethearchaeota archaeon]|nr:MAG: DNA adenine methylase [Candidatus Lokiarchaeota archaeon]